MTNGGGEDNSEMMAAVGIDAHKRWETQLEHYCEGFPYLTSQLPGQMHLFQEKGPYFS